jgi:hypothetical protein
MDLWDDDTPTKRTLGIRDKQILFLNADKKCQNCGKTLEFHEMQVGHKKAASKGGKANLKNCVCLCYPCNKLQGTDNWNAFQKKQGKTIEGAEIKNKLDVLSVRELKFIAQKYNIKVKGKIEEDGWDVTRKPPSKKQYVNKLSKILSDNEIDSALKEIPPPPQKKKKRKSSGWSW